MLSDIFTQLTTWRRNQYIQSLPGTEKSFILCFFLKFQVKLEETLKEVKKHLAPERKVVVFFNHNNTRLFPNVCSHVRSLFVLIYQVRKHIQRILSLSNYL